MVVNQSSSRILTGRESPRSRAVSLVRLATHPKWILSFESFFVLFLFAGVYKGGLTLRSVPVDPTALFAVLSFAAGGVVLVRRGFLVSRAGVTLLISYFAFALVAAASLGYTPGHDYAMRKAASLLTLNALAVGGTAIIIGARWERTVRFFIAVVCLASIVALGAIVTYARSGGTGTISVFGADYLGVSQLLGVGAVILLGVVVFFSPRWGTRLSCITLLMVLLVAMLVTGGRGPVIAVALSALVPLFARVPRSRKVRLYRVGLALLLIALVGALGYFVVQEPSETVRRFDVLFGPGFGVSGGTRLEYYKQAATLWSQRLILGHGIGAWPILIGMGDQRGYPHNILLEIGVEEGLLGVLSFAWFCYAGVRHVLRRLRLEFEPVAVVVLMLVVNTFVNASVSGDLVDNRALFAAMGLCAIACLNVSRLARAAAMSSQSTSRQQRAFNLSKQGLLRPSRSVESGIGTTRI